MPDGDLNHVVVLLSGGLDSTVVLAHAVEKYGAENVEALTINYKQRHGAREIEAAERESRRYGVFHTVLGFPNYSVLASESLLTHRQHEPLPVTTEDEIPATYVPARNTMFIACAAARLESYFLRQPRESITGAHGIVMIGANVIDYSGYPDCRPEFISCMGLALRTGLQISTEYGVHIDVEAPVLYMSKAEIIKYADEREIDLSGTWSCYAGGEEPCGECDSCRIREEGFAKAGRT